MMVIIYQILNTINGHRYIGITKQGLRNRRYKHLYKARNGGGYRIGAAFRKYGADKFEFTIMEYCDSYISALDKEIEYINKLQPEYNVTKGGEGASGLVMSEGTRRKLSEAIKNRPNAWIGRKHKPETIQNLRELALGRAGHWRGKTRPPETREKFRLAKLGKPGFWAGKRRSPETIAKIKATKAATPRKPPTDKQLVARAANFAKCQQARIEKVRCSYV